MSGIQEVVADLVAEGDEINALVAGLDEAGWATPTPSPGWSVKDQIAHLTFIFDLASTAATDADAFRAMTAAAASDFQGAVNSALAAYGAMPTDVLRTRWDGARERSAAGLLAVPVGQIVPWLVNPLPPTILAAAGLMELFGHGQDIADALGVRRVHTDRLKHLVEFSVRVRDFAYAPHGLTPPETEFRFEITAPSGELWTFGPEDSTQRITGTAEDFCLLTTRRRHRDDLSVKAVGAEADQWVGIAQCYRGPAGAGRVAGQFAKASS